MFVEDFSSPFNLQVRNWSFQEGSDLILSQEEPGFNPWVCI